MYIKELDEIKIVYFITGTLINQTPLSIGSGRDALKGGVDNPIVRINGIPYIPGSSLKGALRSEAERYVKSFVPSEFVCDILNPKEDYGELYRKKELKEKYEPCVICRIFGGPTLASHITIYNALPHSPFHTEMRTSVSINRITGGQHPGRLFDVEYVAPFTKFKFEMRIENIDIMSEILEARIIKHLLKLLTMGQLWLGRRKSIGMGNIKLENFKVLKIEIKDAKIYEKDVTQHFLGGV